MNFGEFQNQVCTLSKAGDLKGKEVEIVLKSQKYFVQSLEMKERFAFLADREVYAPLKADVLVGHLKAATSLSQESPVGVCLSDGELHPIERLFVNDCFLELVCS